MSVFFFKMVRNATKKFRMRKGQSISKSSSISRIMLCLKPAEARGGSLRGQRDRAQYRDWPGQNECVKRGTGGNLVSGT